MKTLKAWLMDLLLPDRQELADERQHRVSKAIRQADQAIDHHKEEQREGEARMRLLETQARRHGRGSR